MIFIFNSLQSQCYQYNDTIEDWVEKSKLGLKRPGAASVFINENPKVAIIISFRNKLIEIRIQISTS